MPSSIACPGPAPISEYKFNVRFHLRRSYPDDPVTLPRVRQAAKGFGANVDYPSTLPLLYPSYPLTSIGLAF